MKPVRSSALNLLNQSQKSLGTDCMIICPSAICQFSRDSAGIAFVTICDRFGSACIGFADTIRSISSTLNPRSTRSRIQIEYSARYSATVPNLHC